MDYNTRLCLTGEGGLAEAVSISRDHSEAREQRWLVSYLPSSVAAYAISHLARSCTLRVELSETSNVRKEIVRMYTFERNDVLSENGHTRITDLEE
jgi:hypothetical protein